MMMEMADVRCTVIPVMGAGAALRTYLRAFRGVHKRYLHLYVATYEAMVNIKRVTPTLIRRMCICHLFTYTGYT
jgi:transposase-like protein